MRTSGLAIELGAIAIGDESHASRTLERTGKDLRAARKPYADALAFVFCSAGLSRKTMEADPANVALRPHSIVVHATPQPREAVDVAYRRRRRPAASAASKAALKEVEALIDSIAREAMK